MKNGDKPLPEPTTTRVIDVSMLCYAARSSMSFQISIVYVMVQLPKNYAHNGNTILSRTIIKNSISSIPVQLSISFSIVPEIVLRDCPAYVIHCMACGEGFIKLNIYDTNIPDSKVHGANVGPTWFLSAPDGHHVGPMNLAIRDAMLWIFILCCVCLCSNKPPWGKSI